MPPNKEKFVSRTPSPLNIPRCESPTTPPKAPIADRIKTIRLPGDMKVTSFNERLRAASSQYQFIKPSITDEQNLNKPSTSISAINTPLSLEISSSSIQQTTGYVYYNNNNKDNSTENNTEEPNSSCTNQDLNQQQSRITLDIFAETDHSSVSSSSSTSSSSSSPLMHSTKQSSNCSAKITHIIESPNQHLSPISTTSSLSPTNIPADKINDIIPESSIKYNISPSDISLRSKHQYTHRARIKKESGKKSHTVRLSPSHRYKGKRRMARRFSIIKSTSSVGSTDTSEDEVGSDIEERIAWINRLRPRNYNKVTPINNNNNMNKNKNCIMASPRTNAHGHRYKDSGACNNNNKNNNNNNDNDNNGREKEIKRTEQQQRRHRQRIISRSPSLKPITRSSSSPSSTCHKKESFTSLIRRSTRKKNQKNLLNR
ncbi:hypothetical protein BJ944DRAFT_236369 [Cunninghamella echinulata]|nr:hypothetical protein BJ944DRAFT_236369 [Cunninghamella echinulata]